VLHQNQLSSCPSGIKPLVRLGLVCLLALLLPFNSHADLTCHIHAPSGDVSKAKPTLVGPYPSMARCEQENLHLFLGKGRCHCSFDNSMMPPRANELQGETNRPEILP